MENQPSIDDLANGFACHEPRKTFQCLYCGAAFEDGLIYSVKGANAAAWKAAAMHVSQAHGGAFAALMNANGAGLPAVQKKVLKLLHEGKSDAEIARALGGRSASTVRNHRSALRRREAEARSFLALILLLDRARPQNGRPAASFKKADAQVARAPSAEDEAAAVETRCLRHLPGGGFTLAAWPRLKKDRLVLLRRIAGLFQDGRRYSEKEINDMLRRVWPDHVMLRRYLVEYGLLDRSRDFSAYWRTPAGSGK